MQIWQYCVY